MEHQGNPYRDTGILPGQPYQYIGKERELLGKYVKVIVPTKKVIDVVVGNLSYSHKVDMNGFIYYQVLDSKEVRYCLHGIFNVYFSKVEAPVVKTTAPDPYMCDNCGGHMSYVALVLRCDNCGKREKGW